jgi:release factor glutamine methyltransferase
LPASLQRKLKALKAGRDKLGVKVETSLREALHSAATRLSGLATARRDAQLLLLRVLGRDRAWLFAHPDGVLSEAQARQFDEWIERRARHEPVQYIVGEHEFYGLKLQVTPDVLIPRPETEHLVEAVLRRFSPGNVVRIVDVGTGSGAIAIALAHALPQAEVTGLDISAAALEIARQNAARCEVNGRIRWLKSNLLAAVRGESFDAIVSNPPYVAEAATLEAQVRLYEPREALFAGPTGLEIYERLIPEAREALHPIRANYGAMGTPALAPGGWLLLEIGHGQRDALRELLVDWGGVEFVADLQGIPRVAIARRRLTKEA